MLNKQVNSNTNSKIYLKKEHSKGENGSILIIGGSAFFTGAPYFTAKAALKAGSEIVFIYCDDLECRIALKSLLPEAAVGKIEFNVRILNKITACVIGPGLGRISDSTLNLISKIIEFLNDKEIPFIFDADIIHYYKKGMFNHLKFLILTPNSHEATNLNVNEKHICIYKGVIDILKYPINQEIKLVYDYTCNKRIGGQGDMLSGVLATFVSNCTKSTDEFVKVSVIGCKLMRYVSHLTFVQKGYTMITTDIFKHLNKSTIKFFNK